MAARGGSARSQQLSGRGWGAEVGGDWEAGPGAPARRRLGGAGWEERLDPRRRRGPALESREARARGGAGQRGVRDTWPRGRDAGKDAGRDWGNAGSRLESSGGELRAGPAIVSRGRTGRLRRPGRHEAKHAHARRKVLAGRPGLSLLVPGPWAARGRAEDGEPKAPASLVRAARQGLS